METKEITISNADSPHLKRILGEGRLRVIMTARELFALEKPGLFLAVAQLPGTHRFCKGQVCTLIAGGKGDDKPFVKYRCIESGEMESKWAFDSEV